MATNMQLTVAKVPGSVNAETNKSKIKIAVTVNTSGGSYNADGDTAGAILIDDKEVASLDGKKFYKNTSTEIYSATKSVQHEEDGSKTVTVKAVFDTKVAAGVLTEEKTLKLDTILRSSMSVPVFTLGKAGEIRITPVSEGMEHEILYTIGGKSGTAVKRTAATNVSWTPPMELAEEITDSMTGKGTLTLKGYKGSAVSSRSYEFAAQIPSSAGPKITGPVAEIDNSGLGVNWAFAVQGKSVLRFEAEASVQYGATLKEKGFSFGIQSMEQMSGSLVPKASGSFMPRWAVTDSRGFSAGVALQKITVWPYSDPALKDPRAYRSNSEGVWDEGGNCLTVIAGVAYSDVAHLNEARLRMRKREVGGAWGSYTELQQNEYNILTGLAENKSYEVELSAADALGVGKTVVYIIPTAKAAFVLADGGQGAGFGKYPEQDGLDMAWDIHMNGMTVDGLREPEADHEAATKKYVDAAIAAALAKL